MEGLGAVQSGGVVGYVLSGSTSTVLRLQLTREGEQLVREGMLVATEGRGPRVVARVESLRPYSPVFDEGDEWSAARRLGRLPSIAVEEGYVVAEATVLGAPGYEAPRVVLYVTPQWEPNTGIMPGMGAAPAAIVEVEPGPLILLVSEEPCRWLLRL